MTFCIWMAEKKRMQVLLVKKKNISLHTNYKTVDVAQLVRASDCGSEGRRFETDLPPKKAA